MNHPISDGSKNLGYLKFRSIFRYITPALLRYLKINHALGNAIFSACVKKRPI